MKYRHLGRIVLMKILYAMDVGSLSLDHIKKYYPPYLSTHGIVKEFVDSYLDELVEKIPEIDILIREYSKNWSLERISAVIRALMRIALYEMLYRDDIPYAVAIDEALKIAEQFSDNDAKKFLNGILDAIRRDKVGGDVAGGRSTPVRKNGVGRKVRASKSDKPLERGGSTGHIP